MNEKFKAESRFLDAALTAGIAEREAKNVIYAVSGYAKKNHMYTGEYICAMQAIRQMVVSGFVGTEELRMHLAENLPGAFRFAYLAAGLSPVEMNAATSAREIITSDFLPKFAEQLKKATGKTSEAA